MIRSIETMHEAEQRSLSLSLFFALAVFSLFIYHFDNMNSKINIKKLGVIRKRFFRSRSLALSLGSPSLIHFDVRFWYHFWFRLCDMFIREWVLFRFDSFLALSFCVDTFVCACVRKLYFLSFDYNSSSWLILFDIIHLNKAF